MITDLKQGEDVGEGSRSATGSSAERQSHSRGNVDLDHVYRVGQSAGRNLSDVGKDEQNESDRAQYRRAQHAVFSSHDDVVVVVRRTKLRMVKEARKNVGG